MVNLSEQQQAERLRSVPPVSESMELRFSRRDVFAVLAKPNHLELFHPFCKKNKSISWDRESRSDQIEYLNGTVLSRKFLAWVPNEGFDLLIGKSQARRSLVLWRLSEKSQNESEISISVHPYVYEYWASWKTQILHHFWIRRRLRSYLGSVLGGLDYYLRLGERTPKNFQGSHPWFS